MANYIVFDVETPNRANNRMSSIGVSIIKNGKIEGDFYTLIDPEVHFDYFNTRLTGISAESVKGAPTFPKLWKKLAPVMEKGIIVAHNAVFDLSVLKSCLRDYGIEWKSEVKYLCTVQMGRKLMPDMSHKLNVMCEHYGIALDHHNAASDARACAEIFLRYMESGADVEQFVKKYKLGK